MAIQQSVDGSESSELEKSKVNYYEALAENARKDRKDRKDREEDKNNTSTNSNKNTIKIEDDYFKKKYG